MFSSPGQQGRVVYLPSRHEDGGRGVSGMAQLDVELGRRGRNTKRCQNWRYDIKDLNRKITCMDVCD